MFYQRRHTKRRRDRARANHERHGKRHKGNVALLCCLVCWDQRTAGRRAGKQLEANAYEDDAANNANHAERDIEYSQYQSAKDQKEEQKQRGIKTGTTCDLLMLIETLAFQQFEKDRERLKRIDDREQRGKCADEQSQYLSHANPAYPASPRVPWLGICGPA